jgi:hypothetical protein
LEITVPANSAVKAEVLVEASEQSWVQNPPYNLDPMQKWVAEGTVGKHPLMVRLTGELPSAMGGGGGDPNAPKAGESRVLVAAGDAFMLDPFFGKPNEALVLNVMDWLVRDDGLLAVRSRGLATAALEDISDERRNAVKYLNIVGLPAAFVAFGLVRWRRRETRRGKVALSDA